jgi:hypothetical protein
LVVIVLEPETIDTLDEPVVGEGDEYVGLELWPQPASSSANAAIKMSRFDMEIRSSRQR